MEREDPAVAESRTIRRASRRDSCEGRTACRSGKPNHPPGQAGGIHHVGQGVYPRGPFPDTPPSWAAWLAEQPLPPPITANIAAWFTDYTGSESCSNFSQFLKIAE